MKLICSGGGYGDLAAAEAGGKRVIAAKSSSAAAINDGDDSGEGEGEADYHHHHHHDGGDSDYLPRNFTKYRSLAEMYQSTKPSEIIINTTAKRRRK